MMFAFFSVGVATVFFVSSLVLLNYGRLLGLRYLQQEGSDSMAVLSSDLTNADNSSFKRRTRSARRMTASGCSNVTLRATSRAR
jgi:hypothetical protein